jgi:hypothetical protein
MWPEPRSNIPITYVTTVAASAAVCEYPGAAPPSVAGLRTADVFWGVSLRQRHLQ